MSAAQSEGFPKITMPEHVTKWNEIGHWERAIKSLKPGFFFQLIRGPSGRIVKAEIHGGPHGRKEYASLDQLHKAMRELSIYYQVGKPWSRLAGPAPWFVQDARLFWERASKGDLKPGEWGHHVKRFGPPMKISYTDKSGASVTIPTKMQLIWVSARAAVLTEIELYSFHYLPVDILDLEVFEKEAMHEWNKDMYFYIEKQLIRPDIAQQKLATVNRELHEILIKFFAAQTPAGGIVSVSGKAAHTEAIVAYGAGKWHELITWLRKWYGMAK